MNVRSVCVFHSFAVCGNAHCEYGEQCTDAACSSGCAADCPPFPGAYPTADDASGTPVPCGGWGECVVPTGECVCAAGRVGPACGDCAQDYTRVGDACVFLPGSVIATCYNGVKDYTETGVDCGGNVCPPCAGPSSVTPAVWIISAVVALACCLLLSLATSTGRA